MKIKEFQEYLKKEDIDFAMFINFSERVDPNFTYFTELKEVNGALIIPKDKEPFMIVSPLELAIAKNESPIRKITEVKKGFFADIKSKIKGKKIGLNFGHVSLSIMENIKKNIKAKFVDVSSKLYQLRLIKTDEEIKRLKEAARIADNIIQKAIIKANKDITEIELRDFIEDEMRKYNVKPSFPTIVSSGKNAASPHNVPMNVKLNGFVVIDMGVIYKNYCSDITRTFYIGKPSEKEIEDYENVKIIQEDCIKNFNSDSNELHNRTAKFLGKDFVHSLGHGIGIEVHELPWINGKSNMILLKNMAFTIEPGIYRKNYGIRIEDDLILTDKLEVITKTSKKLVIKR